MLSQIYVRDLSIGGKFAKSLLLYILVLLFTFSVIALLGDRLNIPGAEKVSGPAWPFFSALCVVGFLPLPWLNKMEVKIRGFLQNRALVTQNAEALAATLKSLSLEIDNLHPDQLKDIFLIEDIRAAYASGTLRPETRRWIRSKILLNTLYNASQSPDLAQRLGAFFLNRYEMILNQLFEDMNSIATQVRLLETDSAAEYEASIRRAKVAVDKLYDDTFSFCGCILAIRPDGVPLARALKSLAFKATDEMLRDMKLRRDVDRQQDVMTMGFFYASLLACGVYCLANFVDPAWASFAANIKGGWPNWDNVGANLYALVIDLVWLGAVLWTLFIIRRANIIEGRWYESIDEDDGTRGINAQVFAKAVVLTTTVAVLSLLVLDVFVTFATDQTCNGLDGDFSTCATKMGQIGRGFPSVEGLKIFGIMLSVLIYYVVLEMVLKTGSRTKTWIYWFFVVTVAAVMCLIYMTYAEEHGANIARSSGQANPEIRYGYILAYLFTFLLFWGSFVSYTWRNLRLRPEIHA
ncbi:hypothetical protein ACMDCR_22185 [Labrys okinawensis]|uniref:hypothetical protein n=1 Tax=Labrys okinawensis TaxID=346911 RepID=UPI0039BD7DEC